MVLIHSCKLYCPFDPNILSFVSNLIKHIIRILRKNVSQINKQLYHTAKRCNKLHRPCLYKNSNYSIDIELKYVYRSKKKKFFQREKNSNISKVST